MSRAAVAIAVGGEQHARLRSGRSDRARPSTPKSGEHDDQIAPMLVVGEHRDDRLGHVRHEAGDAVARPDAHARAGAGDTRATSSRKLAIGQPSLRPALVPEHDRFAIVAIAQQVLGEVEPRARRTTSDRARDPAAPPDRGR